MDENTNVQEQEMPQGEVTNPRGPVSISGSEHFWMVFRMLVLHRISQSLEYMYGTGFCFAIKPLLRKFYGHDDEQMKQALKRHLIPYISEMRFGNCIVGAVVAMEEARSGGADIKEEAINSLKTGLMGPFAGLGDSLCYFTWAPLVKLFFLPYLLDGQVWAVIVVWVVWLPIQIVGYVTYMMGYRLGRESIMDLLRSGWINAIMVGAGVMGMFMMGAMSSSWVKLSLAPSFIDNTTGETKTWQSYVDGVLPGLLPLLFLGFSYLYLSKGGSQTKLMLSYVVLGLVGSFIGII